MKKTSLVFTLFLVSALCFGQNKKPGAVPTAKPEVINSEKDTIPLELKVYRNAILFGDFEVARGAIFGLLSKYPARIDYLDTLARIYFSTGAYSQALLAATIYLEKDPENTALMELCAICQGSLNNQKESLDLYEKLYKKTKSIFHAYQIGVLQFTLKRFGECEVTVNSVINDPTASKEKIRINTDQQNSQEVTLSAASLNLRGVLQKELNKNDKAKEDFEAAIKLDPEFVLAKNNLEAMKAPVPVDKKK